MNKPRLYAWLMSSALVVCYTWLALFFVQQTFDELALKNEVEQVKDQIARAQKVITTDIDGLNTLTQDWAVWDDAYEFVKKYKDTGSLDERFMKTNMTHTSFAHLDVMFCVFFDDDGSPVYSMVPDVAKGLPLVEMAKQQRGKGLISSRGSVYEVAFDTVRSSDMSRESKVMIGFGRYVRYDQDLRMQILPWSQVNISKYLHGDSGFNTEAVFVQATSPSVVEGTVVMKDIFNKPVAELKVSVDRTAYITSTSNLRACQFSVAALFALLLASVWAVMHTARCSLAPHAHKPHRPAVFSRREHGLGLNVEART